MITNSSLHDTLQPVNGKLCINRFSYQVCPNIVISKNGNAHTKKISSSFRKFWIIHKGSRRLSTVWHRLINGFMHLRWNDLGFNFSPPWLSPPQKHHFISLGVSTCYRHGCLSPPNRREPLCFAVHVHVSMKAPSPLQSLHPNALVSMFVPRFLQSPKDRILILNDASYLLNTPNQCSGHFQPPGGRRGKSKPKATKDLARPWTSPFLELTFHTSNNRDQIRCFQVIIKCIETYWWARQWMQHILGKNFSFFLFFSFLQGQCCTAQCICIMTDIWRV